MAKIGFTGKQFVVTIPKDIVKIMGLEKDREVIISKYPGKNILFVEKILSLKKEKNG